MITFAANSELYRNRKRVHKACDICKKRRKRCKHIFPEQENEPGESIRASVTKDTGESHPQFTTLLELHGPPTPSHNAPPISPEFDPGLSTSRDNTTDRSSPSTSPPSSPEASRFIGDLNPESVLLERPHSQGHDEDRGQDKIGLWVQPDEQESGTKKDKAGKSIKSQVERCRWAPRYGRMRLDPTVQWSMNTYLDAIGATVLPETSDLLALVDLYFSSIHIILPIVDESEFRAAYANNTVPTLLVQTICLLAAKHDRAAPYLKFPGDTTPRGPREFSERLYSVVSASINNKVVSDKLTLIRILCLLSLHLEGHNGAEDASMHLTQAIHHACSLGLHLGRARKEAEPQSHQKLFWCLWSLDKLHTATNSRPVLLNDRDIRPREFSSVLSQKDHAFGIWLRIAEVLDKVINYYRPGVLPNSTGWESDFPSFDEIVGMGAGSEVTTVDGLLDHPTIAYRHLRQNRLKVHKDRARTEIEECCQLLANLGKKWWAGNAMAGLGHKALSKFDSIPKETAAAVYPQPSGPTVYSPPKQVTSNTQPTDQREPIQNNNISPPNSWGVTVPNQVNSSHLSDTSGFVLPQGSLGGNPLQWSQYNSAFEDIDHLLGEYPDLTFPMNFADPFFMNGMSPEGSWK
ncbi:MAG: hypothetical protein M1834_004781 [Cirrosporium novae-zelandiae]|nr:MAG: hypothetical protein M1834_004781 [Cirrosporium novae-zelandiae]